MRPVIIILLLATVIQTVYCLCNTCSTETNLACVDKNKFKVCVDGLPVPPVVTCPSGTVCVSQAKICSPEATSVPACNSCKICDPNKIFACTGFNAFSLCLGEDTPDESMTYMCPDNLVCNVDSEEICIDRTVAGIGASCPFSSAVTTTDATEATTTTTIDPITHPDEFCTSKGARGRYEIPSDDTCTQYINCYESNNNWYGNVYYCPLSTYFNSNTQVCGKDLPERCA